MELFEVIVEVAWRFSVMVVLIILVIDYVQRNRKD